MSVPLNQVNICGIEHTADRNVNANNFKITCSHAHTCDAPVSAINIEEYDPLTGPPVESRGEA